MTTILTTTGISIHSNTGRIHNTKNPTKDQMRQYLRTNPKDASSEANSLLQMAEKHDHLILFYTKDPTAVQCMELLDEYFQNEGYKSVKLMPLDFRNDPKHVETTGLHDLVEKLILEITKAKRNHEEVIINATAGFKALVVYSTMLGMIYQVPVKYLYEGFLSVVTFNPIAVDWDTSLFFAYRSFFQWVDAEPRTQAQVKNYLKDYPDQERIEAFLTPPQEDESVVLTYMGDALYHQFQYEKEQAELVEWPPAVNVENIDSKISSSIIKKNHHPIKNQLEVCRKIAAIDCVREITGGFYEPTLRSAVKIASLDGNIDLLLADDKKAARFTISTTARGKLQTLKVAEKIKEILEIS